MKRYALAIYVFLAVAAWADNGLPALGQHSLLKHYRGSYDGTKLMSFGTICDAAPRGLRVLRNEIFAKYGRPFADRDLRDHFQDTTWYVANPAYHDGLLTEIDNENVRRILAVEKRSTDSFGLLHDLREGKKVSAKDGLINATVNMNKRTFVFSLKKGVKFPTNPIQFSQLIDRDGGYDRSNQVFMFTYRGLLYLVVGYNCGLHGTDTCYSAISFNYNPQSRLLYNISIGEDGR
jgi:hypothetical protein